MQAKHRGQQTSKPDTAESATAAHGTQAALNKTGPLHHPLESGWGGSPTLPGPLQPPAPAPVVVMVVVVVAVAMVVAVVVAVVVAMAVAVVQHLPHARGARVAQARARVVVGVVPSSNKT